MIPGGESPPNIGNRGRIVGFATRIRLPVVFGLRAFAEAGALPCCGIKLPELERRSGVYVDKILEGARPGSLPIGRPHDSRRARRGDSGGAAAAGR